MFCLVLFCLVHSFLLSKSNSIHPKAGPPSNPLTSSTGMNVRAPEHSFQRKLAPESPHNHHTHPHLSTPLIITIIIREGGRSPTSWLAIPLVRLASSSPWNWVVTLLQDLEGDRPEGGQLGMGCGADTSSESRNCTWLPNGWIS